VAVSDGVVDLVKGHDHAHAVALVQLDQQFHDLAGRNGVKRGDRLVRQDGAGALDQGAGDGAALLLSAGQGVGALGRIVGDADPIQGGHGLGLVRRRPDAEQALPAGQAAERAEHDVAEQAQAADQVELLEDHAELLARLAHRARDAAVFLHCLAEHADLAGTGVDRLQAGNGAQQGGLAGSRRTDQGDHLSGGHRNGHAIERLPRAEGFRHVAGHDKAGRAGCG
jgi:hypothetical protein